VQPAVPTRQTVEHLRCAAKEGSVWREMGKHKHRKSGEGDRRHGGVSQSRNVEVRRCLWWRRRGGQRKRRGCGERKAREATGSCLVAGGWVLSSLFVASGATSAFPVWRRWPRGTRQRIGPRRTEKTFGTRGCGRPSVQRNPNPFRGRFGARLEMLYLMPRSQGCKHFFQELSHTNTCICASS
jgi:hypothetical protein